MNVVVASSSSSGLPFVEETSPTDAGPSGVTKCNALFDPSEYNVIVISKTDSLQRVAGTAGFSGAVIRQAVFLRSTSPPPVALKPPHDAVPAVQGATRRKRKTTVVP